MKFLGNRLDALWPFCAVRALKIRRWTGSQRRVQLTAAGRLWERGANLMNAEHPTSNAERRTRISLRQREIGTVTIFFHGAAQA